MARGVDVAKLGAAIRSPGLDPRHWVSYGTVGVVGDGGDLDTDNAASVHVSPSGVYVDVLLEPSLVPVTCLYAGMAGGPGVQVISPIRPGDRVLVTLPDGNPAGPPVVVAVLHSQYDKVPLDSGTPRFRNDRILVRADGVPVDIQAGDSRVELDPSGAVVVTSGDVKVGDASASEQVIKGTSYRSAERAFLTQLSTYVAAIQPIADPVGLATATMQTAITQFQNADNLSDVTRTK